LFYSSGVFGSSVNRTTFLEEKRAFFVRFTQVIGRFGVNLFENLSANYIIRSKNLGKGIT